MTKKKFLREKADHIRKEVIKISVANGAGHIAPSLSCIDILVALYYDAMAYRPTDPLWEDRDRLIFSKAHGCYGLYAILADLGILPKKEWEGFYREGDSSLMGCSERRLEYGVEAGCGSLGHGLPLAVGLAFGAKMQRKKYHTFCVIGDGELQEGTTWEALQFAVKHDVGNLTILIDGNRLQGMDFIVNILDKKKSDMVKRLRGFGLSPVACREGHDAVKIADCIRANRPSLKNKPKVLVVQTVKGFGLKCMENVPKFHFRIPTEEELCKGKRFE
jgi:transketolase